MKLRSMLKASIGAIALSGALFAGTATAETADVRCDSRPGGHNYCRTNTSGGVTLRHQHSRHGCYQNDTWGYDRGGIWVSNGCSATFRVGKKDKDDDAAAIGLGILALGIIGAIASQDDDDHDDYPPPPPPPPPGYDPNEPGYPPDQPYPDQPYPDQPYPDYPGYDPYDPYGEATIISCDSKNYKRRFCPVPIQDHAELVQQRSKKACRFNKTWGYNYNGVWVSGGCRGDFAIY